MGQANWAALSFANTREQSFYFRNEDDAWLKSNLDAGRNLIAALRSESAQPLRGPPFVFRDVDASHVIRFFQEYAFHEQHTHLGRDLLISYINAERAAGSLQKWNVAVMSRGEEVAELGSMDLGLGRDVGCINRSRYRWTDPCNIKALTSQPDGLVDISEAPKTKLTTAGIASTRNKLAKGIGLLLLYPISKDSTPEVGEVRRCNECGMEHRIPDDADEDTRDKLRHPLNAVRHVLGAAMLFPEAASKVVGDYVAHSLPLLESEDEEEAPAQGVEALSAGANR